MANILVTPPETEPDKPGPVLRPGTDEPNLSEETDGSMWISLISNIRDALRPKEAPLHLDSRPADNDLIIEEEGVWGSLWASVRDVFFPEKLPPLKLESTPIAVVDRMKVKRDPTSTAIAVVVHGVIILAIAFLLAKNVKFSAPVKQQELTDVKIPPMAPMKKEAMGGGGGQRGPTPVTKGTPPKFSETQITPPKPPPLQPPKIAVEPTIDVQKDVKMASSIPQLGVANSPIIGMSMGNGRGTGMGSGNGDGLGPGSGGNTGGGLRHIGGGVSAPVLVYKVDPEFSEEARKAKVSGNVLVALWVGPDGLPSHVRVVRGIGMGLDENAVAAVKQYRFKPAMENGHPVTVEVNVEVDFQIF